MSPEWLTTAVRPARVRTAVLCRNEGSSYPLDSWGYSVADWVRFPWEPEPAPGHVTEPLPPLTGLNRRPEPSRPRT